MLYILHEYRKFTFDELDNMYPFEIDIICAMIQKDKDKAKPVSRKLTMKEIENMPDGEML